MLPVCKELHISLQQGGDGGNVKLVVLERQVEVAVRSALKETCYKVMMKSNKVTNMSGGLSDGHRLNDLAEVTAGGLERQRRDRPANQATGHYVVHRGSSPNIC